MMTRCFSPPLSVENGAILERQSAGRLERLPRDRDVRRAFDGERAEMREAAHQRHLEHGVVERRMELLRDHRDALRQRAPRPSSHGLAVEQDLAGRRRQQPSEQLDQRRLARAVRPEDADERAGRDVERHVAHDAARRARGAAAAAIREREVMGGQQPAHLQAPSGRAPGSRSTSSYGRSSRFSARP